MKYERIIWETIDFKPDNSWEAWHFNDEEPGYFPWPVVGWEVQAETFLNERTGRPIDDQPPLTERPRQYVLIDMDSSGVTGDVDGGNQLWKIVPRGTPPPSDKELRTAWREWKTRQLHFQRLGQERLNRGQS